MTDKLSKDDLQTKLSSLKGWKFEDSAIVKTFEFEDFEQAMDFVNHVASAADEQDHHPDIDIRGNIVKLVLSTHQAGGVTDKDTDLATQIEDISV